MQQTKLAYDSMTAAAKINHFYKNKISIEVNFKYSNQYKLKMLPIQIKGIFENKNKNLPSWILLKFS